MAVALPSMAADVSALTVAVNGNDVSVSVPAGMLDDTSALYLVWDSEDHGDELDAWPVANRVAYDGVLSSSAATYNFATNCLPANYCARAIAVKAVNVIDGYIYCGANQCINTGILATDVYSLAIKYAIPATEGSAAWVLIGAARDNGTIARYSTHLYLRWTGQDQGFAFGNNLYSSSAVHEIAVGGGEVKLDGNVTKSGIPTGAMGTTAKTVLMSAGWYNNTIERYMKARWYYVRLNDKNGNALIDLVPALTNDSVAVFYDKVSHKYYGNTGSSTAALTYSGTASETNFTLASSAVMSSVESATWTGNGETALLSDAGNWTPGLPGAFSNPVRINAPNSKPAIVPAGATAYGKFFVGNGGEGNLTQSQGTITASAINGVVIGANNGGIGTYTMTGGTLTTTYAGTEDDAMYVGTGGGTGYFSVGGNAHVRLNHKLNLGLNNNSKGYLTLSDNAEIICGGDLAVGTWDGNCYGEVRQSGGKLSVQNARIPTANGGKYYLSGGNLEVSTDLFIGGFDGNGNGGTSASGKGEVEMTGGSLTVGRYFLIGVYNTGRFTQSAGDVTCNNWMSIGRYGNRDGYCTVTGGTLTTPGLNIGEDGIGTLTVSDNGTVKTTGQYGITLGANSGSAGTLKLQAGGKIVTKIIKKGSGAATLVEFNGGTIQATTADANILQGLGNIVLKSGGVTIDTQEKNLVIKDCTFNVEPGGKITVTGGGTVTFANCTASLTAKPSEKFLFADTDGVFSGMPTFTDTRGWKVRMSADSKKIRVVPSGMMVIFR